MIGADTGSCFRVFESRWMQIGVLLMLSWSEASLLRRYLPFDRMPDHRQVFADLFSSLLDASSS